MSQSWYVIEPKAPLVFRSGKPFEAGSRDGANFPWPSSLAGLLRTQLMDAQGLDPKHNPAHKAELLAHAAMGPFLAKRAGNGGIEEVWLPKPADAVLLKDEAANTLHFHRLAPGQFADGAGSDLPDGMMPVTFANPNKSKPHPGPQWWPLNTLLRWMRGEQVDAAVLLTRCDGHPWQVAQRTHVGIERSTFAAEAGRLFQTEGLDFDAPRIERDGRPHGWQTDGFVLLARGPAGIAQGAVTFGGERRLSWLLEHAGDAIAQPADWAAILSHGFALTLATPALFSTGWKPGWLNDHLQGEIPGIPGLRVQLRAAVLDRWQGISGWDLAAQQPRAARKAVAAGATYWFEVLEATPAKLTQLWLCAISDHEQDRRDGFGTALPRPWNFATSGAHAA